MTDLEFILLLAVVGIVCRLLVWDDNEVDRWERRK